MIKKIIAKVLGIKSETVVKEVKVSLMDVMKGVKVDDNDLDKLTNEESEQILREAYEYSNTLLFKTLGRTLVNKQATETVKLAENTRQLDYGRAVINATMMYEEEIMNMKVQYEESRKPTVQVENPYEVI